MRGKLLLEEGFDRPQCKRRRVRSNSSMTQPTLLLAAAFAVIATTASGQSAERTSRGRLLVQRYCASCHAIGRTGESPNRAAPAFRDLHSRYSIDDLSEALAEGILVGHPAMPELRFPPQDVQAILAYIKSIQGHEQAAVSGQPPAE
jgi:mono/diheme cytochrome c family protein